MARVQTSRPAVSSRLQNVRSSRTTPVKQRIKSQTKKSPIKQPPAKSTAQTNGTSKSRGRPAKNATAQESQAKPKETNVTQSKTSKRRQGSKQEPTQTAPSTPRSTRSSNPATPVQAGSNASKRGRPKDVKRVADDLLREIQSEPATPRFTRSAPATPSKKDTTPMKKGRGRPAQAQSPHTPQTRGSQPAKKVSFEPKAVPKLQPQTNGKRKAGRAVPKHSSPLKRSAATKATMQRKQREKQASRKAVSFPAKKVPEPERKSTRKIMQAPKLRSQAQAQAAKKAAKETVVPSKMKKSTKTAPTTNGTKRKAESEESRPVRKRVRRTRDELQAVWEAEDGAPFAEPEGDFEIEILVDDVVDVEHKWQELKFSEISTEEDVEDTTMAAEPEQPTEETTLDAEPSTNGIIPTPDAVTSLADQAFEALKSHVHIPTQISDAVHRIEETVSNSIQTIEHGIEAVGRAFSKSPEETRHGNPETAEVQPTEQSEPLRLKLMDVVEEDAPASENQDGKDKDEMDVDADADGEDESEGLVATAVEKVQDGIETVLSKGDEAISDPVSSVKETVSNVVETIEDTAGNIGDVLAEKASGVTESLAGDGQVSGFAEVASREGEPEAAAVESSTS